MQSQFDIGEITEGKVTGITKFGAFVELSPGKSGMVHISEVANRFISDISEVLTVGQTVSVKILSVSDEGKIALSIKKAEVNPTDHNTPRQNSNQSRQEGYSGRQDGHSGRQDGYSGRQDGYSGRQDGHSGRQDGHSGRQDGHSGRGGNNRGPKPPATFEEMMNAFKKTSDEKLGDIKRQGDKRGGRR
jgi:S1 RNA binding domain protein